MAETDDDPIANWNERVTSLRKRGRISAAALAVVPGAEIDVRQGRPEAPQRLSAEECVLWDTLTHSRRPGWFNGALGLLETYCVTVIQLQQIELALRKLKPGTSERYLTLARLHRQSAALAATLATRLRLTPHSRIDKTQPSDGELPVA
jgi:hypothetical protein